MMAMNDKSQNTARIVNSPRCASAVAWGPQSPYLPFCSERCKLGDLGAWATGEYRLPEQKPQGIDDQIE